MTGFGIEFGEDFGEGVPRYDEFLQKVLNNAPPTGVKFEQDREIEQFMAALNMPYRLLNLDIETMQDARFIDSADGVALDWLGEEYGVKRPSGEDDETFRIRVFAGLGAATSGTTWDDFAKIALRLLQTDEDNVELEVDYEDELGAVIVYASTKDIEASPFGETEIAEFLERSLPGSRRVVIRYADGFQFSLEDTTDEKLGKGWGEGVWTS